MYSVVLFFYIWNTVNLCVCVHTVNKGVCMSQWHSSFSFLALKGAGGNGVTPIHISSAGAASVLNLKITALDMLLSFDYSRTVFSSLFVIFFLTSVWHRRPSVTRVQLCELPQAGHPRVTSTWVLSFVTVCCAGGQRTNTEGKFSGQIRIWPLFFFVKVLAQYYAVTNEHHKSEEELLVIFNKKISKNPTLKLLKDKVKLLKWTFLYLTIESILLISFLS